jgi:6,7-dimethyl-8-ribityllumazine synthase
MAAAYDPPPMTRPAARKSPKAAGPPPVAIVVSRYNASITGPMEAGAIGEYQRRGGAAAGVEVVEAPGSFELPALALAAARTGRFRGVVALGCIIKGETSHDRFIAHAVASGLVSVTISSGLPVGFGVLTVDTVGQARARAGGAMGNKGAEAMAAVLDTIREIGRLNEKPALRSGAARPRPDKAAAMGARAKRGGGRR